jgi:uncharacterized protein (UPF0332 family)
VTPIARYLKRAENRLRAARALEQMGLTEEAASSAYYCMFYVACAFLASKQLRFSKHSAVISAFGQYFARTGLVPSEYHRILIEGMEIRLDADYELIEIPAPEAAEQVILAERFLRFAMERLVQSPD